LESKKLSLNFAWEKLSMGTTTEYNLVGVSFWENPSLSQRYNSYLTSSPFTCPSTLLFSSPSCVVVATSEKGTLDALQVLTSLSVRNGFSRCSGRMFAMEKITQGINAFYRELETQLPKGSIVRTHAHPKIFSQDILDFVDTGEVFKQRNVCSSPTGFTHLLVAVQMDNGRVGWGMYTMEQYKDTISRPGDGDRTPNFELNFNRAELKIAEAVQLLSAKESEAVFGDDLLAVDVGAAPGGWTRFLAEYQQKTKNGPSVSVIAIDPAELDAEVSNMDNVLHLQHKAEVVSRDEGSALERSGVEMVGELWKDKFKLLVCDANMDIRDTLRELVLPLARFLAPGGVVIVTIKLGRRVGVAGVARQVKSAHQLLEEGGFKTESIRVHWLFGNSKNERTLFALKN